MLLLKVYYWRSYCLLLFLKTCFHYPTFFDDLAYVAVKQSVEITEGETPIFKQLDIDVTE